MDLPSLRSCAKIVPGQKQLTPEQQASARLFAHQYAQTLLSCAPIDDAEAEEQVRLAYRVAGLNAPELIRWFDSPLAFVLAYAVADKEREHEARVRWVHGPGSSDHIETSLLFEVEETLESNIWDLVGIPLREQVWDSMLTRFSKRVVHRVWNGAWPSVKAYLGATSCACDLFFHEIFEANRRIPLVCLNTMTCGDWLGSQEAWLVRKPIRMARDEQGRLHADSVPCVQFADGWGFSAWHGKRLSDSPPPALQ